MIQPGDAAASERATGEQLGSVRLVEQPEPLGDADAIFRAGDFVDGNPFFHLVRDHVSACELAGARQRIQVAFEFAACGVACGPLNWVALRLILNSNVGHH